MSLAAAASKIIYTGNAIATAFAYAATFEIETTDGSDIVVYVVDDLGNVTQLTGNYTVDTNLGNVNYPTVGGVSPLGVGINALPAGWQIVIARVEPLSQTLVLANQGVFDAASIEENFDKMEMQIQQLQEQLDRCYKSPVNQIVAASSLTAFLAAVNASFPPFSTDTYVNLKILSAGTPTVKRWGFATDANDGNGQLCFYTAVPAIGDVGWFMIPIQMLGGA